MFSAVFKNQVMRKWLFNDIVQRMMHQVLHPYQTLKALCAYST